MIVCAHTGMGSGIMGAPILKKEISFEGFAAIPKGLPVTEYSQQGREQESSRVCKPESCLKSLPSLPDIFLADPVLVAELPGCTCDHSEMC